MLKFCWQSFECNVQSACPLSTSCSLWFFALNHEFSCLDLIYLFIYLGFLGLGCDFCSTTLNNGWKWWCAIGWVHLWYWWNVTNIRCSKRAYMHGYIGANSIVITLDLVDIATTSNYVVLASNYVAFASNSTKVEIQQLATIQAQAIAWKPHSWTSICWGFFFCKWQITCGSWEDANVVVHYL